MTASRACATSTIRTSEYPCRWWYVDSAFAICIAGGCCDVHPDRERATHRPRSRNQVIMATRPFAGENVVS